MLNPANLSVGPCFSRGPATASGTTPYATIVPPYRGVNSPLLYGNNRGGNVPNWQGPSACFTQISTIVMSTSSSGAQILAGMRPFNYCYFNAVAAAGQAVVNIDANPGAYATAYRYPTPNGAVPRTANNLMAANDYVAYQAADGTWILDTVASIATLAVTLTTNLPTGGIVSGQPLFFFGIYTDTDPATGFAQPYITVPTTQTQKTYQDLVSGLFQTLHLGDPLVLYSNNAGAQGTLDLVSAFYTKAA